MKKDIIDLDILEELAESGVNAISLVDMPAIQVSWFAFKKQNFIDPRAGETEEEFIPRCMSKLVGDEGYEQDQAAAICYSTYREKMEIDTSDLPPYTDEIPKKIKFESYTDYPESAKNAAQRALDWAEKNGWGSCGTPVGKQRANQLAKGEPISEETIARMASFARHKQNSDTPYEEGCGKLMWDAWGGDDGIAWAQRKLEDIRTEELTDEKKLKVNDEVSWTTAGTNPRGRIREIIESGSKKIPGSDFEILGTPEDPGFIIEVYEEKDGEWTPTGKLVGRKASSIRRNVNLSLLFADQDKQIIVGPALIPDQEIYRVEDDYEYYVKFSQEVIAKIAEKFMKELKARETNVQHNSENPAESYVMETWLIETGNDKANTKYGFSLPIGTWMIKMRVTDPLVWQKVKAKELNGFSIEGNFFTKEEAAMLKDKTTLEEIIKILGHE